MTRPNWSRLYAKFFPDFTCPASRHVKVISEGKRKGQMRDALDGWDTEHMAEALEVTVQDLWEARKLLTEAGYERVEVQGKWVWRKREARIGGAG